MEKKLIELDVDLDQVQDIIKKVGRNEETAENAVSYFRKLFLRVMEKLKMTPNTANSGEIADSLICQMYPNTMLTEVLLEDEPELRQWPDEPDVSSVERGIGSFMRLSTRADTGTEICSGAEKINRYLIDIGAYDEHPVLE